MSNFYNQAKEYIERCLDELKLAQSGRDILAAELKPYRHGERMPKSMGKPDGIYYKMLMSLKNRERAGRVIGWDSDVESGMRDILFDFESAKVHEIYANDFSGLFDRLKERFPEKNMDIGNPRSIWFQYAKGIISIAKFLSNFKDHQEFNKFVESFSFNEYAIEALPMLLEKEIAGYGFALACDFVKESGYDSYGKPDIHLLDIFEAGGIIEERDVFECFKSIVKIAREVDKSPAIVDKIFWIIGSWNFEEYNKSHENKIPIKRVMKKNFIKQCKQQAM